MMATGINTSICYLSIQVIDHYRQGTTLCWYQDQPVVPKLVPTFRRNFRFWESVRMGILYMSKYSSNITFFEDEYFPVFWKKHLNIWFFFWIFKYFEFFDEYFECSISTVEKNLINTIWQHEFILVDTNQILY